MNKNILEYTVKWFLNHLHKQGVIQKIVLGSSSTNTCDQDCGQALIKSNWGSVQSVVKEGNYYANSKKFVLPSSLFMLELRVGCHLQLKMVSKKLWQIF